MTDCCDDMLKRLDKLDDIANMLKDLADQNAELRSERDQSEGQTIRPSNRKVNSLSQAATAAETAQCVDARLEKFRDPRFPLLGLNVGADDQGM